MPFFFSEHWIYKNIIFCSFYHISIWEQFTVKVNLLCIDHKIKSFYCICMAQWFHIIIIIFMAVQYNFHGSHKTAMGMWQYSVLKGFKAKSLMCVVIYHCNQTLTRCYANGDAGMTWRANILYKWGGKASINVELATVFQVNTYFEYLHNHIKLWQEFFTQVLLM